MIKNYFKIAWRNLWKNKTFSFLNITALAIGMASAILIFLWIENEISFDMFHKNRDLIYEAWNRGVFNDKMQYWDYTPKVLGPTLKQEQAGIAEVARVSTQWFVTSVGDKKISMEGLITDQAFLSIFSFPLVQGDPKTALNNLYSMVITEKMAKKMFGETPAMNQIVKIDRDNFTVTGIMKDLPTNTRFEFDYILPWLYMKKTGEDDVYWGNNSVNTFVQLKPNANPNILNDNIRDITINHSGKTEQQEVFLHPLSKWHLYSRFENKKAVGGQIETIRLFTLVAGFILLIACINFMVLSTARSEKRAKEVGIRKVAGAYKSLLVLQFLGESLLIAVISWIVAILLVQLSLPSFNLLVVKKLVIPYGNIYFWLASLLFIILTAVLAGSYPAFFLSSFQPVSVLKGAFKKVNALVTPRKVLVVIQFTFAITLIISTIVVTKQIRYAQDRDTGYDRRQLIYHFQTGDLKAHYSSLKQDLLSSGAANFVSRTSSPLTEQWSDSWSFLWEGKLPDDKTDFISFASDEGLVKTAGLTVLQGRDMDLAQYATDSSAMMLNESAAKAMGFKNAIGQVVKNNGMQYHVVGIIKDFVINSPFQPVKPMVIMGGQGGGFMFNVINIKLSSSNNVAPNIQKIAGIFKKYNPDYPFESHFVDEQYSIKFAETERIASLSALFAGLTILISCLGLFGLASFMAAQRTKEIGLRKILGASVLNLWQMLSTDFLKLIVISLVIATPVAYYFMSGWLSNFNYRTPLSWWIFASAGLGALVLTLITISYQSIKAALANPVKSLRTE